MSFRDLVREIDSITIFPAIISGAAAIFSPILRARLAAKGTGYLYGALIFGAVFWAFALLGAGYTIRSWQGH